MNGCTVIFMPYRNTNGSIHHMHMHIRLLARGYVLRAKNCQVDCHCSGVYPLSAELLKRYVDLAAVWKVSIVATLYSDAPLVGAWTYHYMFGLGVLALPIAKVYV